MVPLDSTTTLTKEFYIMPEFILDTSGQVPIHGRRTEPNPTEFTEWRHLDSFTQGYIEALFFTESGSEDDGKEIGDAGFADLAPESLADIIEDCTAWQAATAVLLEQAYECEDYSPEQAGRDYWFTRNGHGVGFWDRKQLNAGHIGDKLAEACQDDAVNVYLGDDGNVYLG
jgi:hypothetical protein